MMYLSPGISHVDLLWLLLFLVNFLSTVYPFVSKFGLIASGYPSTFRYGYSSPSLSLSMSNSISSYNYLGTTIVPFLTFVLNVNFTAHWSPLNSYPTKYVPAVVLKYLFPCLIYLMITLGLVSPIPWPHRFIMLNIHFTYQMDIYLCLVTLIFFRIALFLNSCTNCSIFLWISQVI